MTVPRLELRGVSKRFGPVVALHAVDLALPAGTIHGIVGENGAGKSTLVGVVGGALTPDDGAIVVDGVPLTHGARAAHDAGVAVVHQHFALVGPLTVAENFRLGRLESAARTLTPALLEHEVREAAARHRLDVGEPSSRCDTLPVGAQARLEILRALRGDPRILLLDEPTAVLTPAEADELFETLRALRAAGMLVVFITHKLEEALELCDTNTVLRGGTRIATMSAADVRADEIAALMVGDATPAAADAAVHAPRRDDPTPPRLVVEGLATTAADARVSLRDVGFAVGAGEIRGIGGVDGNGQEELAAALYGLVDRRGTVTLDGRRLPAAVVVAAQESGIALIPPDRRRDGLALGLSVWENAMLAEPLVRRLARPLLDRGRARDLGARIAREYHVGRGDPDQPVRTLSGGNQQRLVIGRAMALEPRVLVAVNPTRGLDIAATAQVHAILRRAAADGAAIVLISTDLDELRALCRDVLVLFRGRLLGPADAADGARIGALMAGIAA